VRVKLRTAPTWPTRFGEPLNQGQLLGTMLSFVVPVFEMLERVHALDPESSEAALQREAYLHRWCIIGHLLGIDLDELVSDDGARLLGYADAVRLAGRLRERYRGRSEAGVRVLHRMIEGFGYSLPLGMTRLPAALVRLCGDPAVADTMIVSPRGEHLRVPFRVAIQASRLPVARRCILAILRALGERWERGFERLMTTPDPQVPPAGTTGSPVRPGCRDEWLDPISAAG
jgi:hypothetical protein